jgi:hypothetical protein
MVPQQPFASAALPGDLATQRNHLGFLHLFNFRAEARHYGIVRGHPS